MKRFNINNIPPLTKNMYEGQQRWIERNWKDTLKKHHRRIEAALEIIGIFDSWKEMLNTKYPEAVKGLMPEIYMDSYMSVHFSCMGLYKQAHVCLRAQLENVLRLVYFATHPVEFRWWDIGNDYFKKKDVWMDDYHYFRQLEEVKEFQKKCADDESKINLLNHIGRLYSKLSQYVHSSKLSFQTTPDRFSPKYKKEEFGKWNTNFVDTQGYINTLLVLGFANEFKLARLNMKKRILRTIRNDRFKRGLRKSLGLRFKGRI